MGLRFLRLNGSFWEERAFLELVLACLLSSRDLIEPSKFVGVDGFTVSQVEWFILGGKGFP